MATVEERLDILEREFAQVKELKGIAGPRGPAGNIDAAIANVDAAVSKAESRVQAQANVRYDLFLAAERNLREAFETQVRVLRVELDNLKKGLDERIKNEVDGHAIQVLHDYHLLKDGAPTLHADVSNPANQK
jgi:hypothetical protein